MESQGASFFGSNSFGIQSTSTVTGDVADLLFGGTAAADPKDIKPVKIKEDEDPEEKPDTIEITPDDLLDDIDSLDPNKKEPEKKVKEPTKTAKDPEPVIEDEDSTFSTLSKNLVDLGIFTQTDSEELPKTAEEFKDKWIAERQEQVNSDIYNFLISKHGEEGLKTFEDIFVKGVSPRDYLSKFTEVKSFKDLDLTSEINQEKVVRESFRRQGLKEEIIDKKVQKLKDYGDLEEEAALAHEIILNQEETELQNLSAQKEAEHKAKTAAKAEYDNTLQTELSSLLKQREFDGIPVTDKVAREVYDMLTTEKWQLPNGEKLTDYDKEILELRSPQNIKQKIKFALLLRNKLDLSKIKTNLVSKETNKLFEDLVIKDKQIKRTKPVSSGSFFEDLNK